MFRSTLSPLLNQSSSFSIISRSFASSSFYQAKASFEAPKQPELLNKSYHTLLKEQVKSYPFKDCIKGVPNDEVFNYQDILRFQDALASGLKDLFRRQGCVFASALPTRPEAMINQAAASRGDIDWAPICPVYPAKELEKTLKIINPTILAWQAKVFRTIQIDEIYQLIPYLESHDRNYRIHDPRFPSLQYILHFSKQALPGLGSFADIPVYDNPHGLVVTERKIDEKRDNTIVLHEDGEITRFNQFHFVNTGYLVGHKAGINEEDIICFTLPHHTTVGLSLGLGLTFAHKTKMILASELFSGPHVAAALATNFCTTVIIESGNLLDLISEIKPNLDLSKLSKMIVVCSPGNLVSRETLATAKRVLGLSSIVVAFGTPKTAGVISMTNINEFETLPSTFSCVGSPLPHTKVEIVSDGKNVVEVGEVGELVVSGFHVPSGTHNTGVKAKLDSNNNIILV